MISTTSILGVLVLALGAPADGAGRLDSFPVRGWRFTTERPPAGWERESFDDSRWKEGEPGFGNRGLPPLQQAKVKTPWNEPEIWTRARLDLDRIPERLAIRWSHDEDAEVHVNPRDGEDCRRWWKDWRKSIAETGDFLAWPDRPAYAKGSRHEGQPVVISETGNWWIAELPPEGPWAPYGAGPVPTVDAFLSLCRDFFLALMAEPECAGFSYVQLYDVEGEVNGHLTYDRRPKMPPEAISGIHSEGLRHRAEGAEDRR
jgi:hypothetical protein